MLRFFESAVEQAALTWLKGLGYATKHGSEIILGELLSERKNYDKIVLGPQLRDGLARLNADLPPEALYDAFRKITRPAGPTLEARNLGFPRQHVGVAL